MLVRPHDEGGEGLAQYAPPLILIVTALGGRLTKHLNDLTIQI